MKAQSKLAERILASTALPAIALTCLAAAVTAGCSSSSDVESSVTPVGAAVQNLTVDPTGHTVVATVVGLNAPVTTGSIVASGGQNATAVAVDGDAVTITFDARVTPSHRIRLIGLNGVDSAWKDVTTTDPRVPQLGVLSATQDTSDNVLGGDTIIAAFVAGARVIEAQVEDPSNWTLTVQGVTLDMTGTTISLQNSTQVVQFTLGPLANLHANFQLSCNASTVADTPLSQAAVPATATGDTAPPSLEGGTPLIQNLATLTLGDEYGRVIEVDFDEPISPVFGASAANFSVVDHPNAIGITTPTRVAIDTADNTKVRVFFSRPVVPGLDQILLDGIVDAHGNALAMQTAAITAQSPVANVYTSVQFVTREGTDNDQVIVTTSQALDPDTAALASRWTLTVGGLGAIDLAGQTRSYDMLSRTLTIDLDFDAPNGTTADIASVGGVDIDGQDFTMAATQVTAAGDATAPTVLSLVQNRVADTTGRTIDVTFSEDVDVASAASAGNYTFSPAIVVNSATLLGGNLVRLQVASVAIPGDVQLTVAQAVSDPAGNDLGAAFGPSAITSTDQRPPVAIGVAGRAVEGFGNDVVTVLFDDTLIRTEAENTAHWTVECPVGTPLDVTGTTIVYDEMTSVATMTLDGGAAPALLRQSTLRVSFATMRDLGGNTVTLTPIDAVVTGESTRPVEEAAFIVSGGTGNEVLVRFSEAMDRLTDLYNASTNPAGARFVAVSAATMLVIYPTSATVLDDGLGVHLTYPTMVDPAEGLDIVGLTDLAGNVMFPALDVTLTVEDPTAPSQSGAPGITAISGIRNDVVAITFSDPMASWRITSPSQYVLRVNGGAVVDLSAALFEFDGSDTVTVTLAAPTGNDLVSGATYDLQLVVDPNDPLRTRQGVPLTATDTQAAVPVAGDVTSGPTQAGTVALLDPQNANAIIIVFDETIDPAAALQAAAYDHASGSVALSVSLVSPRAVRATFGAAVSAGSTVDVTNAAAVDTAGNAAAGTLTLAVIDDQASPSLVSASAAIVGGFGGDRAEVTFSEEVDAASAGRFSNYTVTGVNGVVRVGTVTYDSNLSKAVLFLEDVVEGDTLLIEVDGVTDLVGNTSPTPLSTTVMVTGDATAPSIVSAYVNLAADSGGLVVEVEFSEDVDTSFAAAIWNWSRSGSTTITGVEAIATDHVRLLLSASLGATETITLAAGLTDPASNTAVALIIDPID